MHLPLPKQSPYLTRNYTSSLCTETDSVCTNVTHSSFIRSPYMTRHSKLLGVSSDESKGESLPSTPRQDHSGCHSYKEHIQDDNDQSPQVSSGMNVSSPNRSFIVSSSFYLFIYLFVCNIVQSKYIYIYIYIYIPFVCVPCSGFMWLKVFLVPDNLMLILIFKIRFNIPHKFNVGVWIKVE